MNKQVLKNCQELNGIIGLLSVDAESDEDKMYMAGNLVIQAINLYLKSNMDLEEINDLFNEAVPEFSKKYKKRKK